MSRTLYLECYSGISGDMTASALFELGADQEVLDRALKSLPIHGSEIEGMTISNLDGCDSQIGQDADQGHYRLSEVLAMIQTCDMTERAKETAAKVFKILLEAEAKPHIVSADKLSYQEAGMVNAIMDVVTVAVCLDDLDITDVIVPVLYEGRGTIQCEQGILPIPVPAVMNIVAAYNLQLHIMECEGEFITPTGAAIVAAIRTMDKLPNQFTIDKIGLGIDRRERTGSLRAILLREDQSGEAERDKICKLECNIDDCSGEALGLAMDYLLAAGARDVHYTPVFMKKNRPAYQLNVICSISDIQRMEQIIFENTTTIGIRRMEMERSILKRELRILETSLGEIQYKICKMGERVRVYPEYESIASICRQSGISYGEVYQIALNEYHE